MVSWWEESDTGFINNNIVIQTPVSIRQHRLTPLQTVALKIIMQFQQNMNILTFTLGCTIKEKNK